MSLPKILFCGDMRSPFIRQDSDLLRNSYTIEIVDFSKIALTFKQIPKYFIEFFRVIISMVKRNDLIYIWFADYPAMPIIWLAKKYGKCVFLIVGGWEVVKIPEISYGNQLNPIRGAVTRWCLRNADIVIVPSNSYRDITKKLEPRVPIVVIPNCIDTTLCDVPIVVKENCAITAICTSSTEVLKGVPIFTKAKRLVPYRCCLIKNMPHDKFMQSLRGSKVYCCLSYTESFGMTVLEAMAAECVPVVTDRDALPEIVGSTGLVVPYGDVNATAVAINNAMKMSGKPARERARQFSREIRLKRLTALIEDMI